MKIEIDHTKEGFTVLDILKKELRLSSKLITALKKLPDGITVNGEHVTVRRILHRGDLLSLATEDREKNEGLVATEMPLDIVFEDDDIILINKPPMMPTHPSHGHFTDTLANGLCFYMQRKSNDAFVFRSVNRLDRNTSGLVLVAKNRISAMRLYSAMQKGEIRKKYVALLDGDIAEERGRIETYIRRREASIILREVCGPLPDASIAVTEFEVLEKKNGICAVRACPLTGRTHQLRLHFAHLGAPILGDDLYGHMSEKIERQALHASSLEFPHPKSGEMMTFYAPLPEDMKNILKQYNMKTEV